MSQQDLTLIKQAWRRYTESESLDLRSLRPEVVSSWQRCHNLNINPHRDLSCTRPDLAKLRQRLTQKEDLVGIARPVMERLYAFVKGTGFEVILTDETGFVLDVLGDDDILARSEQVQLCPGGDWSEAAKGTNAIGTAIFERQPVQVFGSEHYCEVNHFLVCSASPIFDADGQMIGVLDISGDYRFATPHTLGMVVAAAGSIENQLRLRKSASDLYIAYEYCNAALEAMPDGVISLDTRGFVRGLNRQAAHILGVDPNAAYGQHISKVLHSSPSLQRLLSARETLGEREIPFRAGARLSGSTSLLRGHDGALIGSMAVFREVRCPHALAMCSFARYTFDDIIGASRVILNLKVWAKDVAATPSTVLIEGESGTGKELFAQAIHAASARRDLAFVAVNCAALPETLIESELFGYEDGAFTGAREGGNPGKFEIANGGTLFLDEIGDMPPAVQMKVLRAIQERTVSRVGSNKERQVDIRIIAATSKSLEKEIEAGRFRQELYYRLHVLDVHIPPLRDHIDDIPALARHFVNKTAERLGLGPCYIEPKVIEVLQAYSWPGNIRELENAIERALTRSGPSGVLSADAIELGAVRSSACRALKTEPGGLKSLRDCEREIVVNTLSFYKGNVRKTAAKLGIGRNTLYRKMREYDLLENGARKRSGN